MTCKIEVLNLGMNSSVNFENPMIILNFKDNYGISVLGFQPKSRDVCFSLSSLRSRKGIR